MPYPAAAARAHVALARSPYLVYDSFTGTNGTLLTTHTPDVRVGAAAWALASQTTTPPTSGTATIQGGKLQIANDGNGIVIDVGVSDFVVRCEYTPEVGVQNRYSLVGRYDSDGNMFRLNMSEQDGTLSIVRMNSGTGTTLATKAYTFTEGTTYTAEFAFHGDTVTASINGTQELTYSGMTNFLTATKAGVMRGTQSGTTTSIDNFRCVDFLA